MGFQTPVLVEELEDGDVFVTSVIDARVVARGPLETALAELAMFLEEKLKTTSSTVLARFASMPGMELVEVEVPILRADLPDRIAQLGPVSVACVRVTAADAQWAIVPALSTTLHLGSASLDSLEAHLRDELARALRASELDGDAVLALLPSGERRLVHVDIDPNRAFASHEAESRARAQARLEREATELLLSAGEPRTSTPTGQLLPFVGREAQRADLAVLLGESARGRRKSVVLTGPRGVGKSALLRAFLDDNARSAHPRRVVSTSGARLIAGASGFGAWAARAEAVMKAAAHTGAILVMDPFVDLFAERAGGNGVDFPSVMKRYVDDGLVTLLAEATDEGLALCEAMHAGFTSSFQRVPVPPLDARRTHDAMRVHVLRAREQTPRPRTAKLDDLARLQALVARVRKDAAEPGRSVRFLLDVHAAAAATRASDDDDELTFDECVEVFSRQTGLPAFLLAEAQPLPLSTTLQALEAQVVGQSEAVRAVAETLARVKAGVQAAEKPLSTFLFVGPSGTGKTELARALARFLFGGDERLVRFDMSEYADGHAARRLVVGTDTSEGLLTRAVRRQPFCVLLFDEVEKASPAVFDLFLQLLGEGRLSDARGRTTSFHNALVILTSNLGSRERERALGFSSTSSSPDPLARYRRAIEQTFRPELIGRLDRIVPFAPLSTVESEHVAKLVVEKLARRRGLRERALTLALDPALLSKLALEGAATADGARALRRHVEDRLVTPVAAVLAPLGAVGGGGRVVVTEGAQGLDIDVQAPSARKGGDGLLAVSRLRRRFGRDLELSPIVEAREALAHLVVQQNRAATRKGTRKQAPIDHAAVQRAQHELETPLAVVDDVFAELCGLEESLLTESMRRDDALERAEALRRRASLSFVQLLLGREGPRHEIALLFQELDGRRALDQHLPRLLASAARRRWQVALHVGGGPRVHADAWPAERKRLGPPRDGRVLEEKHFTERTSPAVVLAMVHGPDAGLLLALEAGLHVVATGTAEAFFLATRLSRKTTLTDAQWREAEKRILPSTAFEMTRGHPPVRHHGVERVLVRDAGALDPCPPSAYFDLLDDVVLLDARAMAKRDLVPDLRGVLEGAA